MLNLNKPNLTWPNKIYEKLTMLSNFIRMQLFIFFVHLSCNYLSPHSWEGIKDSSGGEGSSSTSSSCCNDSDTAQHLEEDEGFEVH